MRSILYWLGRSARKLMVRVALPVAKASLRSLKYGGIPLRDPALIALFGQSPSAAGMDIDENTSQTFASYFSGINLIASTVAMLGLQCVKVAPNGGTSVDTKHIANQLFDLRPNCAMTPYIVIEKLQWDAIGKGNGYAWIERTSYNAEGGLRTNHGIPVALWPMQPEQIEPQFNEDSGDVEYKFSAKYEGEEDCIYPARDIIHIVGYLFNGLKGCSLASFARNSIGLGVASETFGCSFFANNAVPGGIITHPGDVDEEGKRNLEDEIESRIKGPMRANRLVVLDEGMKFTPLGISNEDSQFLQTREFQSLEMARWLRIPPSLMYVVGSTSSTTDTESQGIDFLTYSLSPWMEKWVQELRLKLLTPQEQSTHTFAFNIKKLIKLDTKTRYEMYATGRNSLSIYSINDIRRAEGMPEVPPDIGETYIAPSTMRNLGQADPSVPVAPEIIAGSLELITSFTGNISVHNARELLVTTMPSANVSFINSLLATLVQNGKVKADEQAKQVPL